MKSLKGFARRKSAGNVLDDFDSKPPQETSFRVFTRPEAERAYSESPRPAQRPQDGTNKLAFWNAKGLKKEKQDLFADQKGASVANRGSGGSSSNTASSRLSSSSTVPSSTEEHHIPPPPAIPKDEPVFQVRAAGRTFSFGARAPKPSIPAYARQSTDEPTQRDRAMTQSSYASTATPPRLETTIGTSEGIGFGDMFGNIGSTSKSSQNSPDLSNKFSALPSWSSQQSSPAPEETPLVSRRQVGGSAASPILADDEDARLVMESYTASRALLNSAPSSPGLFDSHDSSLKGRESAMTTPKAQFSKPTIAQSLATHTEERAGKKVMTPAQFERYRRESEISRQKSDASNKSDGSDSPDAYEDEDEAEQNRQIAKQRRKQEAHLAVYRQQMMKVTGEQQPFDGKFTQSHARVASASTPNLLLGSGTLDGRTDVRGKQSEDEDDDIPLAILQAHGFPSKTRPPSVLSGAGPGIRAPSQLGSYPPPPASVSGAESVAGSQRHSALPVFARGLPQDPYYGNGQSSRHSIAMGQPRPGSAGGVPPGGLIGVIAGEERARAIRRGSPNNQPPYDSGFQSSQLQQQQPPAAFGPFTAPDQMQATAQMSAQMQQMMQMQMAWMQEMMRMQGMPTGQPTPMLESIQQQQPPSVSPNFGLPRPASMLNTSAPPYRHSYAPSVHSAIIPNQGYAPSIAPSERSNVGMPSRYRPVSQVPNVTIKPPSSVSGSSPNWEKPNPLIDQVRPLGNRKSSGGIDEDDDEEAWAELKKKKEKKRSMWKRKKEPDFPNYQ